MQLSKLLREMAWQHLLGALPKDLHEKTQFKAKGHVLKPCPYCPIHTVPLGLWSCGQQRSSPVQNRQGAYCGHIPATNTLKITFFEKTKITQSLTWKGLREQGLQHPPPEVLTCSAHLFLMLELIHQDCSPSPVSGFPQAKTAFKHRPLALSSLGQGPV